MRVLVSIARQRLQVLAADGSQLFTCAASTAARGTGNRLGSFCTPLGHHQVQVKVGGGLPHGAVLRERCWTGEICTAEIYAKQSASDWILTRVLWLGGCESGYNQHGKVDTLARCIYIHGSPEGVDFSKPGSRGCIRVSNEDVMHLYDMLPLKTPVDIRAE